MKVIAWNVNHRAARREIPPWVAQEITAMQPDILVLTEYVEGTCHEDFIAQLRQAGLAYVLTSEPVRGQNQVLVACSSPIRHGHLAAPRIHPSVPPNILHVVTETDGVHCLGVRVPAFDASDRACKRRVWDWMLDAAQELVSTPALITGDLNTGLADPPQHCGDCMRALGRGGWTRADATGISSWGTSRVIDHLFASPQVIVRRAALSWEFRRNCPELRDPVPPGTPDHAMLAVEVQIT